MHLLLPVVQVSEEQLIEAFANMDVPHVTLPDGQVR